MSVMIRHPCPAPGWQLLLLLMLTMLKLLLMLLMLTLLRRLICEPAGVCAHLGMMSGRRRRKNVDDPDSTSSNAHSL